MNILPHFLSQLWAVNLGWTLVHFLWQGTAIVILFATVRALASGNPRARHALACLALGAMTATPVVTWVWMSGSVTSAPTMRQVDVALTPAAISSETPTPVQAEIWLPWIVMLWLAGVIVFSV